MEAFQATLQEVVDADLLLVSIPESYLRTFLILRAMLLLILVNTSQHVIDSSASNADEQREAVLKVLRDIGVSQDKLDTCMVEAWNKVICDRYI